MKILHITSNAYSGGIATVFNSSVQALKKYYPEVKNYTAFCPSDTEGEDNPDLSLSRWDDSPMFRKIEVFFSFTNFKLLSAFLSRVKPDIVHIHGAIAGLSPSILLALKRDASKRETAIFETLHTFDLICPNGSGYDYKRESLCLDCAGTRFKLKIFYRGCNRGGLFRSIVKGLVSLIADMFQRKLIVDKWIVPSLFLKKQLLLDRIDESKIKVVRNLIPVPDEPSKGFNEKLDQIVYFGRFSEEKNILLLLQAFDKIIRRPKFENFQLRLVGDGNERGKINDFILSKGLDSAVKLFPFLQKRELNQLLYRSKILVLPSKCYETSGLVIPESVMLSIVPITTDHGGMLENLNYLDCGLSFQSMNVNSLVASIEESIINYEVYFKELSKSQQKIIDELSPKKYASQMMSHYKSAIGLE
jgi:glycosyltransferase involved in cell wall biosynthesis